MKQELQVKKDSIQQLKRLLQTKQVTKTDTVYKVKESLQKAVATVDTTTITAFYKIEQRTPNAGFCILCIRHWKENLSVRLKFQGLRTVRETRR